MRTVHSGLTEPLRIAASLAEMASVYEDLGRPLLAQSTRETLAQL